MSGDKSGIGSELKHKFQRTGTSHLLAISGMHIGLMAACAYAVLYRVLGWIVLFDRFERWAFDAWIKRIALIGSVVITVWYGHQGRVVGFGSESCVYGVCLLYR